MVDACINDTSLLFHGILQERRKCQERADTGYLKDHKMNDYDGIEGECVIGKVAIPV